MNLGLAAYGRSFTLSNDSTSISIGTESIGGGFGIDKSFDLVESLFLSVTAGPYTKENGSLAYFEVMLLLIE